MLFPNAHSFLLVRKRSTWSDFSSEDGLTTVIEETQSATVLAAPPEESAIDSRMAFLRNEHSFLLVRRQSTRSSVSSAAETLTPAITELQSETALPAPSEEAAVGDTDKRSFLKVAGIAGAGLVASQLFPNKASALILGSSPTTGVVGVKNASNVRINPATEETVATLATEATVSTLATEATVSTLLKPADLDFDVSGYLNVNVASPTTTATETTLETIAFGGKKYALKMTTVGSVDYIAEADTGTAAATAEWRAKKVDSTSGIVVTWADGNANFDNVATDLTALTYT